MDDNEQAQFSPSDDLFSEEAVESSLVDALSDSYEVLESPEKKDDEVLLHTHLENAFSRFNSNVSQAERDELVDAFEDKLRIHPDGADADELVDKKLKIWEFLTGKRSLLTVETEDGRTKRPTLIDTENPENNQFAVMRQYRYQHPSGELVRPDIVLFVNGIPVYVVEVKSTASSGDAKTATADIRNQYEEQAPSIFMTAIGGIGVADTGVDVSDDEYIAPLYYRGYNALEEHESPWYNDALDEEFEFGADAFGDLCQPDRVLEMFEYGQFYSDDDDGHIVARHQQYFVARRIVSDVREKVQACGRASGRKQFEELISHVQGSGKTYAMLFAARWAHSELFDNDVRMLVLVDRTSLDENVKSHLNNISGLGFTYSRAGTTSELRELIAETDTQLILTTIQKVGELENERVEENGGVFDVSGVSPLTDDVFLSFEDEVHREMLNKQGAILKAVFPKLIRYGFTGTPTEDIVREMGGDGSGLFFHEYSLRQSLREGVTVTVEPSERLPDRVNISDAGVIDDQFEEYLREEGKTMAEASEIIQRAGYSKFEEYWPSFRRLVAEDIASHFERAYLGSKWNAMMVCGSKKLAAQYAELLQEKFGEDVVQPVYSEANSDDELVREMLELDKSSAIKRFKDDEDSLQLLVVCEMLLTGFDAPSLKCMYLNRDISKEHTLLQAIARVNRPTDGKEMGKIIDYKGSTEDLEVRFEGSEFTSLNEDMDKVAREYFDSLDACLRAFDLESWDELNRALEEEGARFITTALSDDESKSLFTESFKKAKRLRERLLPDTRALQYDEQFDVMANIYRKTGEKKRVSGLAEAVGRAGGKTLDEEVDLEMFEETDGFEMSAESLTELASEFEVKDELEDLDDRVREMETEYDDVQFSDRVSELYSQWNNGGGVEVSDIEDVREELDEYEENALSLEAQKLKNLLDDKAGGVSEEEVEEIVDQLEAKSLNLSEENTNKIIGNLTISSEFPINDYSLVQSCVEIVQEANA